MQRRGILSAALVLAFVLAAAWLGYAGVAAAHARLDALEAASELEVLGAQRALVEENLDNVLQDALLTSALEGHRNPDIAREHVAQAAAKYASTVSEESGDTVSFHVSHVVTGQKQQATAQILGQTSRVLVLQLPRGGTLYTYTFTGGEVAMERFEGELNQGMHSATLRLPFGYTIKVVVP